jgi:hypothetical protein
MKIHVHVYMQLQCMHMSTYHLSDLMRISKESSASAYLSSHAQDVIKFRLLDRKLVFILLMLKYYSEPQLESY